MITKNVRNYLKAMGKKGGKARAKKLNAAARSSQARKAILIRWMNKRFGTDRFEKMRIPGWEIVDAGLSDLVDENISSVSALAVAELRPKLRFLGVPVPDVSKKIVDARNLLYRKMVEDHGDMAHARFCALLERIDGFCDALASVVSISKCATHRDRRWCA